LIFVLIRTHHGTTTRAYKATPHHRKVAKMKNIMPLIALIMVFPAAQASDSPVPRTQFDGRSLAIDFPGLHIGIAEYEEGPTGTTVFYFPEKIMAAVDARGGATGTINTDYMRMGYESKDMDAIVLSGGSWYGLSAGTGVANAIKDNTPDPGNWEHIAGVGAAIIFDLGGRRFTTMTPDDALGRAALNAAKPGHFPLGARGAGRFAMQGAYFAGNNHYAEWPHSGQGGAFRQVGVTKIAVFTVVNSMGSIVDRDGNKVGCGQAGRATDCGSIDGYFDQVAERIENTVQVSDAATGLTTGTSSNKTANTTISIVVTNQKMPWWALNRLAVQVHTSMGRAIQPFSTQSDGDVLFAVTTAEVDNPDLTPLDLSVIASDLAWDAVLASVPDPDPVLPTELIEAEREALNSFTGDYEFSPEATLEVRLDKDGLVGRVIGNGGIYFPNEEEFEMTAVGPSLFHLQTPRGGHIRFEGAANEINKLTLNPGQWSQSAHRKP
jgi:L-aminopeptidase/D-esterase-like protein